MAQYFKSKEFRVDNKFMDYFYLNDIKNYDELYIINDSDFHKIFSFDSVVLFENKENSVNDNNPIYLNLKLLNNAKVIYLKEDLRMLEEDNIKRFIDSFNGIIVCNIELIDYLLSLNLIKEKYILNKNNYLKIDKYGIKEEISIN